MVSRFGVSVGKPSSRTEVLDIVLHEANGDLAARISSLNEGHKFVALAERARMTQRKNSKRQERQAENNPAEQHLSPLLPREKKCRTQGQNHGEQPSARASVSDQP